jgi:hypothetical protein
MLTGSASRFNPKYMRPACAGRSKNKNGYPKVPASRVKYLSLDQKLCMTPTPNNFGSAPTLAGLRPGTPAVNVFAEVIQPPM